MDYTVNRVGFTFTVIKYHYDRDVTGAGYFLLPAEEGPGEIKKLSRRTKRHDIKTNICNRLDKLKLYTTVS